MDPVISDLNRHLDKIERDEAFGEAVEKKLLEMMEDQSTVADSLEVEIFDNDNSRKILELVADILTSDDIAIWHQDVTLLRSLIKEQLREQAVESVNEDIAEAKAEAAEAAAEARAARMEMNSDV